MTDINEAPEGDPVEITEAERISMLKAQCDQLAQALVNCKSALDKETARAEELSESLAGYAETERELAAMKRAFAFLLKTTEHLSEKTIGYWEYSDE